MNDDARFERLFVEGLHDVAPARAPDRLRTQVKTETGEVRPRPRWLALIKEPPMRTNSRLAVGSPTARVAAIVAATLLATLFVVGAGIAGSHLLAADDDVIVVAQDGSGDFSTITDAVGAAKNGDEILIRPGTYTEAVVIDKDITLRGEDRDGVVIMAPDDGPTEIIYKDEPPEEDPYAILLRDSNAHLLGLTFRGQRSEVFASGGSPVLEGLHFGSTGRPFQGSASASGSSIVITDGSTAHLLGNELVGGGPIGVFDGSEPLVEGNVLRGGPHIWGVAMGDGSVFRGNTIEEPMMWAFGLVDEDSPTVVDNVIIRPGQSGIEIWGGAPSISGNVITGPTQIGINVSGGEPVVDANTITDSTTGIWWRTPAGSVTGNDIAGGKVGLLIADGAPAVSGNSVMGAEVRGIVVLPAAAPTLSGNRSCGNVENLLIQEGSAAVDDGSNEICEDAPPE